MNAKLLWLLVTISVVVGVAYLWSRKRRPTTIVLGQELANAREKERMRLQNSANRPSPLSLGKYETRRGELGLLKPLPSDMDEKIRVACSRFRQLPLEERTNLTAAVSMDEFYTLLAFARRAAVFSLRRNEPGLVQDALAAVAMVEAGRIDFRDMLDALALLHYSATRLGLKADALFRETSNLAEPETAKLIAEFADRDAGGKDLTHAWGYKEVTTEQGIGFVRWGFHAYSPTTNLLDIATRLAAAIDAEDYSTQSIEIATVLPEVWLKSGDPNLLKSAYSKIWAGATISAFLDAGKHPNAGSQMFAVFLVEVDSPSSAEILEKLSRSTSSGNTCLLGVAEGNVFCLVVARAFVQGVPSFERGESLNRFSSAFRDAIRQGKH